ncbi:NADP-dependent oxidoreductase [Natronogracilivirga saccharolytica]|uniref:NADP-dependent oxidoreductase n=1 Tax=Natronogracilivirga saccharolytica TaxID=2812953 RepID=A0A8J7S6J8_9BACT|nr:NADP-dependent oxidoreductase [Natronogracilivirga saccharolytica]MBP3192868.1 NADP-dependent oxidoreductase [Natronogracilivirga saccharolytica]
MSKKMKASYIAAFGGPDSVTTGELDRPEPGEGEVLVRVKSAGVNPVDSAIVRGMLKDFIPSEFPLIPGWDVAGVVEARGHAARRFSEGDAVYAYARRPLIQHGAFAEYISLPESYLAHSPTNLTTEEAGGIPLAGLTAWQSLFDAGKVQKGDTVLILGASGGVGTFAVQFAKWNGARVIGVASSKNHDYLKELGADDTVDYKEGHVGEAVEKIVPAGVDMIFDCSRGEALAQSMDTLIKNGRLVSITNSNPDRRSDIRFQYVFVEPNARQLEQISELADNGELKAPVTKAFRLEEAGKALEQVELLHTRGKMVITP